MGAIDIIINVLIVVVALTGAVTDVAKRKIYDWLTYPAIAAGLILQTIGYGWGGIFGFGLISSLAGAAFCMVVFGAFCLWGRGFGFGDVKLMAALGALAGFVHGLRVAMLTTLIGAAMALFRIIIGKDALIDPGRDQRRASLKKERHGRRSLTIPYGIAIALGAIWATCMRFGFLELF
ncbi:MAG TPA: A24 family peptidase [Myxococcota bacterium]|nr:A24 family peptidase [Myxococcota bacterium]